MLKLFAVCIVFVIGFVLGIKYVDSFERGIVPSVSPIASRQAAQSTSKGE